MLDLDIYKLNALLNVGSICIFCPPKYRSGQKCYLRIWSALWHYAVLHLPVTLYHGLGKKLVFNVFI